ncbi:MAG TPA: glycosyltransferase family 2 protein [Gemmatimonadaceae bacterium]
MSAPLVSVVIPAFNSARWIGECIDSVLAQSHRELEVIVGDNGSTDGTQALVSKMGGRVRLVAATLRGPGAARNAGLDAARGEYVQFLDSDDLLEPWKIERQLDTLRSTGADIVWGPFWTYEEQDDGSFVRGVRRVPDIGEDPAIDLIRGGWLQLGCTLQRQGPAIAPLRMIPTEHLEEIDYHLRAILGGARLVRGEGDSGLLFRQHRGARVSDNAGLRTAHGTRRNVRMLVEWWTQRGELTPSRRRGLAAALVDGARVIAQQRPAELEALVREIRALDPRFVDHLPPRMRLPSRLIGYERVEHLARLYRATRARLTGSRGARS